MGIAKHLLCLTFLYWDSVTLIIFHISPSNCYIFIRFMDYSSRGGTGGQNSHQQQRISLCIRFSNKETRKLIEYLTILTGNTNGRVFIRRSACVSWKSQAIAHKLLLQREFPATQCTPVRELKNSVPENIFFFATPVLIGNMVK